MNQTLEIQELAIVITAKNYDPSLLNPGFLKYSGIVPEDWELARQPIVSNRGSQIVFNNGVYIVAQPNRLMFVEALNNKAEKSQAEIPAIAKRYVEVLRSIDYQAAGINYRGYVTCTNTTVETNRFLFDNLIQPGEWQDCGTESPKAGLNLLFTYEDKRLNLSINEAGLKMPEAEQVPIVLFSGNFDYDLNSDEPGKSLEKLESIIDNYGRDLETYTEVVSKVISQQNKSQSASAKEAVTA